MNPLESTGPLVDMGAPEPEGQAAKEEIDFGSLMLESEKLEQSLRGDGNNLVLMSQFAIVNLKLNKKERARPAVEHGLDIFMENPISGVQLALFVYNYKPSAKVSHLTQRSFQQPVRVWRLLMRP